MNIFRILMAISVVIVGWIVGGRALYAADLTGTWASDEHACDKFASPILLETWMPVSKPLLT